jgi:hypothetical protein
MIMRRVVRRSWGPNSCPRDERTPLVAFLHLDQRLLLLLLMVVASGAGLWCCPCLVGAWTECLHMTVPANDECACLVLLPLLALLACAG